MNPRGVAIIVSPVVRNPYVTIETSHRVSEDESGQARHGLPGEDARLYREHRGFHIFHVLGVLGLMDDTVLRDAVQD